LIIDRTALLPKTSQWWITCKEHHCCY